MATLVRGFGGLVKGAYDWTLGPVVNLAKSQTYDRVKPYLPQNQQFYKAQGLNHQIEKLQDVLEHETTGEFTDKVDETSKTIEGRAGEVQARLTALEGNYFRDPKGLLHQAKVSGTNFAELLEEQKALHAELKNLGAALNSISEEKQILAKRKVELVARQQKLCGTHFADRSGLLHKAWNVFKKGGHGHGHYATYMKLESERANVAKELRLINIALAEKPTETTTMVAVTKARIQTQIEELGVVRDNTAAEAGVDVRKLGWRVLGGAVTATGLAASLMYLWSGGAQDPSTVFDGTLVPFGYDFSTQLVNGFSTQFANGVCQLGQLALGNGTFV